MLGGGGGGVVRLNPSWSDDKERNKHSRSLAIMITIWPRTEIYSNKNLVQLYLFYWETCINNSTTGWTFITGPDRGVKRLRYIRIMLFLLFGFFLVLILYVPIVCTVSLCLSLSPTPHPMSRNVGWWISWRGIKCTLSYCLIRVCNLPDLFGVRGWGSPWCVCGSGGSPWCVCGYDLSLECILTFGGLWLSSGNLVCYPDVDI